MNGHFPPAAIFGPDGEPKLSWRVAILPFLDQGALFQKFHLNEPWDSPHNKALVAQMPEVFTTPSSPTLPGTTRIRSFEGPHTFFGDRTGLKIPAITDGTSNTLAIMAASEPTPWTRPGELPFVPAQVRASLDNSDPHGALVGITDGSVRYIARAPADFWSMFVTPSSGEVLSWAAIPDSAVYLTQSPPSSDPENPPMPTPPVPTGPNPAPAPALSPDLEARLRAIEAKLDRVIRRLDGASNAPK